jgi:hypothetical protein
VTHSAHLWLLINDPFFLGADDEAEGLALQLVELDHGVLRLRLSRLATDVDRDIPQVALAAGGAGDGDFVDPLAGFLSSNLSSNLSDQSHQFRNGRLSLLRHTTSTLQSTREENLLRGDEKVEETSCSWYHRSI